jgi:hypothetical protein
VSRKKAPPPTLLRIRLIDDFRWVAKHAWSVRFNVLAALLGGLSAAIGVVTAYQTELPIGPVTLACTCGLATVGASLAALAARFVKQDRANPDGSE